MVEFYFSTESRELNPFVRLKRLKIRVRSNPPSLLSLMSLNNTYDNGRKITPRIIKVAKL